MSERERECVCGGGGKSCKPTNKKKPLTYKHYYLQKKAAFSDRKHMLFKRRKSCKPTKKPFKLINITTLIFARRKNSLRNIYRKRQLFWTGEGEKRGEKEKEKKGKERERELTKETSLLLADVDLRMTHKKAMAKHRKRVANMATTTMRAMTGSLYLSSFGLAVASSLEPAVNTHTHIQVGNCRSGFERGIRHS